MDELEIQKGIFLRYHDIGNGFPIIFVHGTPSSSDEFITVINKFKNTFRVIAQDHIGFGASDKPKNYNYTIKNHQENFSKLIQHLNLKKFHIVVHDFGGIISLPFILENMNLISSLVIINSWAWPMSKIEYFPNWMKFLMSSATWKKLIPNAKTKVLENVGHFVADEAPELMIEEIENFYSK